MHMCGRSGGFIARAVGRHLVATDKVALIRMLADVFFLDALDASHLVPQSLQLFLVLLIESCISRLEALNLSFQRCRILAQSTGLVGLVSALAIALGFALDGCFACSLHGIG